MAHTDPRGDATSGTVSAWQISDRLWDESSRGHSNKSHGVRRLRDLNADVASIYGDEPLWPAPCLITLPFHRLTISRSSTSVDYIRNDLRYAVRQVRRNPALAVTAILALTLGIGLTTTV